MALRGSLLRIWGAGSGGFNLRLRPGLTLVDEFLGVEEHERGSGGGVWQLGVGLVGGEERVGGKLLISAGGSAVVAETASAGGERGGSVFRPQVEADVLDSEVAVGFELVFEGFRAVHAAVRQARAEVRGLVFFHDQFNA